jgi:hypothetical protein
VPLLPLPLWTCHSEAVLPRRYVRTPSLGVILALALIGVASFGAHAVTGANWSSTNWTGVVGGAPVPGDGLPLAPMPPPLLPMPPHVNPAIIYEPQTTCDAAPKLGAVRISQIITSTYGKGQYIWIPRGCNVGGISEHKEGRAIDWMVSVRDRQQRANAEAFLNWLLGPDQTGRPYGHALQLGVMYVGWHDRIWRGFGIERGWQELKGCFSKKEAKYDNYCHRNHIHISLTRLGATGLDPTGAPILGDPMAPPPPEAPLDDLEFSERPPAPAQPGPDEDLFMSIGAEMGYQSDEDGPLLPREVRTVSLAAIPENATSALVSVTTRAAKFTSRLRVGLVTSRGTNVSIRVPKTTSNTSVVSVPVSNGTVQISAIKSPMHVRLDVLGYAVDNGIYPAVGSVPSTLYKGRFAPAEVVVAKVRGVGSVPRKKKKVTAVILRVTAAGKGSEGRFAAYPVGGVDLGTRSAVIPAVGRKISVVIADIGKEGQIALAASVPGKVRIEVVGYIKR